MAHPDVQRAYDEHHMFRIAARFDPGAVGVLDVVPSDKPTVYWVVDGQHRLLAGDRYFNGNVEQLYECKVHHGLSVAEVAGLCLRCNVSRAWHALDRWKLRLIAQDPKDPATEIEAMLHRLKLKSGPAKHQVRAVVALERAWRMENGQKIAARAVQILWTAWGKRRADLSDVAVLKLRRTDRLVECYDAIFISGVAVLLRSYGRVIDDDELAHRMSKTGTPAVLIGMARSAGQGQSLPAAKAMALALIGIYNKGRRSQLIPRMIR